MKFNKATERFCYFSAKKGSGKRWGVSILILAFSYLNPLLVFSAAETENAAKPATLPVKAVADSAIEKRLRAVIDNIDDFQNVKIDVNDGVVRLSGTALRKEATEKVAQMVSRFEGVIYVDNQIKEDLSATHESNLLPKHDHMKPIRPLNHVGINLKHGGKFFNGGYSIRQLLKLLPQSRKRRRASESRRQG